MCARRIRGSSRGRSRAGRNCSRRGSWPRSTKSAVRHFKCWSNGAPPNTPDWASARNSASRSRKRWQSRCGVTILPAAELAVRVGRGERSAIGVHGFDRGGLIVEAGKRPGQGVSPLIEHVTLPREWRVVLFTPPVADRWHGDRERRAFATAAGGEPDALLHLAHRDHSGRGAGRSGGIRRRATRVQPPGRRTVRRSAGRHLCIGGNRSGDRRSAALGVRGVGQSSWGPTVFAVVGDPDAAAALVRRFRGRVPVHATRVSVGGLLGSRGGT